MNKTLKIYIILLFVTVSCSVSSNEHSIAEPEQSEIKLTQELEAQYSNKKILTTDDKKDSHDLDSVRLRIWTDKYIPFKYDRQRLYTANLYSVQPQINNHRIISIYSNADHWSKIHLISLTEDLELIDYIEVADNFSDLVEQAGDTEIIQHNKKRSEMISDNEYLQYSIKTMEVIDYYKDTTTYETDSITSRIKINNEGRFSITKLDSARKDYRP